MSGLFRRARALRTRMDLLGELQNDDLELEIPEDEKQSVLSGIDSMLKDDRISLDEGVMRFTPKKKSFVLPLLLNVGAVVILAVGAYFMWRFFDRSETALVTPDVGLESAEGRILNRLRQDAEAELGAKDREIADIKLLMEDLESQKSLLAVETESKLAEREDELRKEFDIVLSAEQARLSESGISGNDLTRALAAYEAEVRSVFESDLTDARAAAAAEQERRVTEMDAQRSQYENQILAADAERNNLQRELDSRKAELAELARVQAAEADEATRQLDELRALQEREKNITAQILAFYERVGLARSADDPETAMATLDSLDSYLDEDGIRGTGVVESRREIDGFLTGALRRLIVLETSGEAQAVMVDDGSAEILAGLAAGAVAGTQLSDAGDIDAAQEVWRGAFSAMPELEEAFNSALTSAAVLTAAQLASARGEGVAEGLSAGRSEAASAKSVSDADLDTAREEGFDSGRVRGREDSADEIKGLEALLADVSTGLESLQGRYRRALNKNEDDAGESRRRLLSLLDTKLTLKSELDPSLYDSLDNYTDTTGDLRELEGREAVYVEILEFLSELSVELEN